MTTTPPGSYGIDAPWVTVGLTAGGAGYLAAGAAWLAAARGRRHAALTSPAARLGQTWALATGTFLLASAGSYLYTTLRGKFAAWSDILDDLALRGDERVLDLGCGRGMVLVQAAERLDQGRATGVDLWRSVDQSGNDERATRANARAAGVHDRVELRTGDMTELPFDDDAFDVIVSSLAVHNIPDAAGRRRAIEQAARVLRPGGRLAIADFRYVRDHAAVLDELGWTQVTRTDLGPRFWYGGPWAGTCLLTATKPAA